jgi:hypothetical protein
VPALIYLGTPGASGFICAAEIASYEVFWHDEVRFCISHKGFNDPFGLRVSRFAEVWPEAVVAGEAHIGGRRHDDVGDDATF